MAGPPAPPPSTTQSWKLKGKLEALAEREQRLGMFGELFGDKKRSEVLHNKPGASTTWCSLIFVHPSNRWRWVNHEFNKSTSANLCCQMRKRKRPIENLELLLLVYMNKKAGKVKASAKPRSFPHAYWRHATPCEAGNSCWWGRWSWDGGKTGSYSNLGDGLSYRICCSFVMVWTCVTFWFEVFARWNIVLDVSKGDQTQLCHNLRMTFKHFTFKWRVQH